MCAYQLTTQSTPRRVDSGSACAHWCVEGSKSGTAVSVPTPRQRTGRSNLAKWKFISTIDFINFLLIISLLYLSNVINEHFVVVNYHRLLLSLRKFSPLLTHTGNSLLNLSFGAEYFLYT